MRATDWIAIAAVALGCGLWALLQIWIQRRDPGNPGVDRDCDGGCGRCATANCETRSERSAAV
jgi:hypothetical protein